MRKILILPLIASISTLGACQLNNQTLGGVVGAGAGAGIAKAAGGGTLAIVVGAAAGAWFGSELGKNLTERDRTTMQETAQYALDDSPSGSTSRWENPDSGNSGTITPQDSFQNAQGQECREFHQSVSADGQTETGYGTACKQADGSWKVVG
ncbi:MAG: RT0821/Lpp0805 family surface protein [Sphingomonadales bacterium]